ncbi:MAG: BON domain-containing protein [Planctomycetes bacterium]|nr:BON domain-containing protein [Planctomycetota bacterium]
METIQRRSLILSFVLLFLASGCDQQQPIATKPLPTPGEKAGETVPVAPDRTAQPQRDDALPLPPATAPTTPGVPNHPGAPQPLPPPPTSSPTTAPALAPPSPPVSALPSAGSAGEAAVPPGTIKTPSTPAQRDSSITSAVYRVLSAQPGLSHDGALITISTLDGEVTLRGAVATDSERDHLAVVAGQVTGVRMVDNQLDLLGP